MNRKKKVLFVGSFKNNAADGSVGGILFACNTLINSELKNAVDFILIDTTAESVPAPPPYKRIPKALKRLYLLLRNLITNKIDVAIIFSSAGLSLKEKGTMVIISKMFNVKVIFAPVSGLVLDEVDRSSFTRYFLKQVIKRADIVICQGHAWKLFYTKFQPGKPEKFRIVLNWIDTNKYQNVFNYRLNHKTTSNETIKLLYLGWLEPYKGIADVLDVFDRLINEGKKIEADIYGKGSMFDDISNRVNGLGLADIFRLRGWADEPTKLQALKEADIFILASYREGMPNALIEAMASGLPCISSEVGGVADLITHNENGLIFTSGDQDKLYENISFMYTHNNAGRLMGENAYKFVGSNCSINAAVIYFEDMLNSLMN